MNAGAQPDGPDVSPSVYPGNPSCADIDSSWSEFKVEPPTSGIKDDPNSTLVINVEINGALFDWSSGTFGIDAVIVKGGDKANAFVYEPPAESTGDDGLFAPGNSSGGPAGLSHISFCYDDDGGPPAECETDCNDGSDCTIDECVVDTCVHTPVGAGTVCGTPVQCAPGDLSCACDAPDECDGTGECVPTYQPSTTTCRQAADVCDATEVCTGASIECPEDAKVPSGQVCNEGTGECDPDDVCDGVGDACAPVNAPTTQTCTDDGDVCTTDFCDGAGTCAHPPGNAGAVCLDGTGECDPDDVCDGQNAGCAAVVAPATQPCTDDGLACTTDLCTGTGTCAHPAGNAGTECRAADGECDAPEVCTGESAECPGDGVQSQGTDCNGDEFACTDDRCDGVSKACLSTPSATFCNDNEVCTLDVCVAVSEDPPPGMMSNGCLFAFNNDPEQNPEADDSCEEVCRTAGFWGTHGGTEKRGINTTAEAIALADGCFTVCDEVITNTTVNDTASAIEAMCLSKTTPRLQLARQLTAAALNCLATGASANCEGTSNAEIFKACDDACGENQTTGTIFGLEGPEDDIAVDCVAAIDCMNNGGSFDVGTGPASDFCQIGVCDDEFNTPCGSAADCGGGACVPTDQNCHDRDLTNVSTGNASSSSACSEAGKTACTLTPTGESSCTKGPSTKTPEGVDEVCPVL